MYTIIYTYIIRIYIIIYAFFFRFFSFMGRRVGRDKLGGWINIK